MPCRRDPSLWRIHHYHLPHPRHHRLPSSRPISTTPSRPARHDDADTKRPDGISDRQWLQLQQYRAQVAQYRRWRRKLHEEPYRALFGDSEDMLMGRARGRGSGLGFASGLASWVPAWMLEVDEGESKEDGANRDRSAPNRKTKKEDVVDDDANAPASRPKEREPAFPQPAYKPKIFEREDFGIVSPSDLRRPREEGVRGGFRGGVKDGKREAVGGRGGITQSSSPPSLPSAANPATKESQEKPVESKIVTPTPSSATRQPTASSNTKSVFVNSFFANKPHQQTASASNSWRQTTLQRRAAVDAGTRPTAVPALAVNPTALSITVETAEPLVQGAFTIPSSQAVGSVLYGFPTSPAWVGRAKLVSSKPAAVQTPRVNVQDTVKTTLRPSSAAREERETPSPTTPRSTAAILDQLPKDDVDFLTAADLRAAMAGKRAALKGVGSKELERQTLEKAFADTRQDELDPVVESSIVNNQYVRRTQRAMQDAQESRPESLDTTSPKPSMSNFPTASPPLESSVDRMKRWLEEGGSSLSKHFWQDPIDESGPSQHDLHFLKQAGGFGKGRRAVVHIVEDLKKDLPASWELLDALDRDQSRVEQAIQILRHPKPTSYRVETSPSLRLIKERCLRTQFDKTEKQLDAARAAVRELAGTHAVSSASGAFKNRLDVASKIFHKNATLTRTLMWSAQARLEDPDVSRAKLELYSEVLARMTTLRDTQLALARLVDDAMHVYGVVPKPVLESVPRISTLDATASTPPLAQQTQTLDPASTQTNPKPKPAAQQNPASTARLDTEVQALKSAMQGLFDNGRHAMSPKKSPKSPLDAPNPLAHSLFRPFNLQLEGLTKEIGIEKEGDGQGEGKGDVTAESLHNEMRRKERDGVLVEEIRRAYEDAYGKIEVGHTQGDVQSGREEGVEMLGGDAGVKVGVSEVEAAGEKEVVIKEAGERAQTTTAAVDAEVEVLEGTAEFEPASTAAAAAADSTLTTASLSSTPPPPPAPAPRPVQTPSTSPPTYTILHHDAHTQTLTTTHTSSPSPVSPDTTSAIPLHTALATLTHPSVFLPRIPVRSEIIAAKHDLLVLRSLPADAPAAFERTVARTPGTPSSKTTADADGARAPTQGAEASTLQGASTSPLRPSLNPIDGTARLVLSPTGYVGVGVPEAPEREDADREFALRRDAAVEVGREEARRRGVAAGSEGEGEGAEGGVGRVGGEKVASGVSVSGDMGAREGEGEGEGAQGREERTRGRGWRGSRRGGGGGVAAVFRAAIWAGAACYVVGVLGEVVR